jgi:RNA polymerase sigma-70 factor (ECF subfamily)
VDDADQSDFQAIAAVLKGDSAAFEPLVKKYQPRVFATARRYARRKSEVEDIVQEVFIKAHQKLGGYRAEAPFEHWLMRLAVRTCFDFLRRHQRNREIPFTELSDPETDWLETCVTAPDQAAENAEAARQLVGRILEQISPSARLVITLLEIEEHSIKEIAALTGWSVPVVKVRAFRARQEMKKRLARLAREKYM